MRLVRFDALREGLLLSWLSFSLYVCISLLPSLYLSYIPSPSLSLSVNKIRQVKLFLAYIALIN